MTLNELLKAAIHGAPEAQYVVGIVYENGFGVVQDKAVAEEWFSKSAAQGFAASQYELSVILQADHLEPQEGATSWLRKSALQGFSPAQYLYSMYCEQGVGMAVDTTEAFKYSLLAAERGYSPAARRVASMLEQGIGVPINMENAFFWYCKAAELGDIDSTASVGRMYAHGVGVEKDEAKALEWFKDGQRRGSPWAMHALASAHRFGELGQPVDLKKANEFADEAQKLIEARAERGGVFAMDSQQFRPKFS